VPRLRSLIVAVPLAAVALVPLYGDPRQSPVTHAEWARMVLRGLELDEALEPSRNASDVFTTLSWRTSLAYPAEEYQRRQGMEIQEQDGRRLLTVTDPIGKILDYDYDLAGRLEKVGAGSGGTVYPIDFEWDNTGTAPTGLLQWVDYANTEGGVNRANYAYDAAGRLDEITDWVSSQWSTDGIAYTYDALNRVDTKKAYNYGTVDYDYDEVGRLVELTDAFGAVTEYDYDDLHRLTDVTGPGGKHWDFFYNLAGQVTRYDHPNGLATHYDYRTDGALEKIRHQDGANVLQSFEYAYDDAYAITNIAHADGSNWDYEYDARYRLDKATRNNKAASPTIHARIALAPDGAAARREPRLPGRPVAPAPTAAMPTTRMKRCTTGRPARCGRRVAPSRRRRCPRASPRPGCGHPSPRRVRRPA